MPWHAPLGLGISTGGLNFADIKIDGSLSDGICITVRLTKDTRYYNGILCGVWNRLTQNRKVTKGGKAYQCGL